MNDWREKFEAHILERGIKYYEQGRVSPVEKTDCGYRATVHGSDSYTVDIFVEESDVTDMECSCPYAESGENCKHMAAVMMAVENGDRQNSVISFEQEKGKRREDFMHDDIADIDIEDMVRNADRDELEIFLISELESSDDMMRRFNVFMNDIILASDLDMYREQLIDIFSSCGDEHGFVSYYMADELEDWLYDFIEKVICGTFMRFEKYDEAFMLDAFMLEKLERTEIDDSNGIIVSVMHTGIDILHRILKNCSDILRGQIFDWLDSKVKEYGRHYTADVAVNIWRDDFDEKIHIERKKKTIMEQLAKHDHAENSADEEEDDFDDYYLSFWLDEYFHLAQNPASGLEENDVDKIEKRFWRVSDVRKHAASRFIAAGQIEKAIEVLKESRKLDEDYAGLVHDYTKQIADLYEEIGDKESCRQELKSLFVRYKSCDIDDFRKLKNCYDKAEWPAARNEIFASLKGRMGVEDMYIEEGLYDRVMESVKRCGSLYLLERYSDVLKERYPEEIVSAYGDLIREEAKFTGGRAHYKKIVKLLRKLKRYPGGKEAVRTIVDDFREEYRNRPAMMDELDRL